MKFPTCLILFALGTSVPTGVVHAGAKAPERANLLPAERTQLGLRSDAGLDALRGGRSQLDEASRLQDEERAALRAAQERSTGLEDMRAGSTEIVLAVILLVVILLILI